VRGRVSLLVIESSNSAAGAAPAGGRSLLRRAGATAVTVPVIAVSGCGGSQSTLDPASKPARDIADVWWVLLVGSAVVFAVVLALVVVVLIRRHGDVEPGTLEGRRLPTVLVGVGGVLVPFVVLAALFALTLGTMSTTSSAAGASSSALTIEVTGRQWFWDVTYPGHDLRTANEIHVPVGKTVTIVARTGDVIHSFWVPQLNRKIDMIPGRSNRIRLRAERAGVFRGQCAEFCGLQHAHMALLVVAEPPAEFAAWLARESRAPPPPATQEEVRGQQVLLGSSCVYCHTVEGTNASGVIGPSLSHVASRRTLAAGTLANTPGSLAGWILDPQHAKPGNRMPATSLTGPQLQELLAYLRTLK
jgi:cytochrome c oxidase subunit II